MLKLISLFAMTALLTCNAGFATEESASITTSTEVSTAEEGQETQGAPSLHQITQEEDCNCGGTKPK